MKQIFNHFELRKKSIIEYIRDSKDFTRDFNLNSENEFHVFYFKSPYLYSMNDCLSNEKNKIVRTSF